MSDDIFVPESDPLHGPRGPTRERATPRFETEPYQITGPAPLFGSLLLVLALPIGGLLVGFLAAGVARWLYLVLVFPFLMGFMAGGLGWCLVKIGKARTRGAIWSATILTATVMMFGLHYGEYVRELVAEDAQIHGVLRKGLTDVQSFLHFVDRKAQDGVRIGRRGKQTNLGYVGSYIYWLVEIGVAGGAVFLVLRKAADAPLCAVCQRWKEERELGMMSDMLSDKPPHLVASMLVEGKLLALMEQAKSHCSEGLLLKAAACPHCGADTTVEVTLEHVTQSAKRRKQTRRLERVCYPGDVLPFLDARGGLA